MGVVKKVITGNPVRQGSSVVYVDGVDDTQEISASPAPHPSSTFDPVLDKRYLDPRYYVPSGVGTGTGGTGGGRSQPSR